MLRVLPMRFGGTPTVSKPVLPEPAVPTQPPFPTVGWKTIQPDLWAPLPQTEALKRFVVIGDAGTGLQPQFDIGAQMAAVYDVKPYASVLVLGDNVYEYGDPRLFETRIHAPYKPLFERGVRFYPVLGNHDVKSGFGPQQSAYWGAPPYYNRRLGNVEIFALDTTVFLPGYDGCYKDNPFMAQQMAKTQLDWLEKVLSESTARFKVVFGHYPIYSSGMHGAKETVTLQLRQILEPVFEKYGVDLYLAGHEHHYEKSQPIKGVRHFVSGAAGKLRPNIYYKDNPPYPRETIFARHHFMMFEETPAGLKYDVISKHGKILDSGLIPPKTLTQVRFAG